MAAIRIFISVLRSQIVTSSSAAHGDRRRGDQENAGTRFSALWTTCPVPVTLTNCERLNGQWGMYYRHKPSLHPRRSLACY